MKIYSIYCTNDIKDAILVYTGIYRYILVYTGIYWYILVKYDLVITLMELYNERRHSLVPG